MASIGVGLTAQLGAEFWALVVRFIVDFALVDGVNNLYMFALEVLPADELITWLLTVPDLGKSVSGLGVGVLRFGRILNFGPQEAVVWLASAFGL
ncbi:hypothetical protein RF679_11760 [Undibacterium cyanobacteriorum]|uniref:Uncharacterized protein n=1 Tax=Undibacterium cyanobacteriorum TaxID=3073561 RepID=A0ABY9RDM6_9BURK|nr:hypothetical protein [Undibacterium sp. 20NA77.5]WMW79323.1 hypothetical protein RF679_11760 [Undibacterium sp. 20NA77.5]